MTMEKNEVRYVNEVERIRKETHASICREWEESAPGAVRDGVPPTRIFAAIAARHGMTAFGVEKVLRAAGLYDGAKNFKKSVMGDGVAGPCEANDNH